MRITISASLILAVLSSAANASVPVVPSSPAQPAPTAPAAIPSSPSKAPSNTEPVPAAPAASNLVIPRDTPVHLMVISEVSTKDSGAGTRFKLRVNQPVTIDGHVVIPVGTMAWGEVLSAERSGNLGKSGQLAAKLLYVDLNGRHIAISGETQAKGNSGTAETVLGVIGIGIFGLFAKGNNAKIKAGELMTAFTADDVLLEMPAVVASANATSK